MCVRRGRMKIVYNAKNVIEVIKRTFLIHVSPLWFIGEIMYIVQACKQIRENRLLVLKLVQRLISLIK